MKIYTAKTTTRQPKTLPKTIKPWLIASGSLTRQLRDAAGGVFRVQPIFEGYKRLTVDEARWLDVPHTQLAWVREAFLYGSDEQPWVLARSVFPLTLIQGKGARFKVLQNKPIGKVLFFRQSPHYTRKIAQTPLGWSRQSCYVWQQQPLLVEEIFLSAFNVHLAKANAT